MWTVEAIFLYAQKQSQFLCLDCFEFPSLSGRFWFWSWGTEILWARWIRFHFGDLWPFSQDSHHQPAMSNTQASDLITSLQQEAITTGRILDLSLEFYKRLCIVICHFCTRYPVHPDRCGPRPFSRQWQNTNSLLSMSHRPLLGMGHSSRL